MEPGERVGHDPEEDPRRRGFLSGAGEDAVHRRPLEVFHREEILAVLSADVEGLDDVRVVEARGEPRLIDEHGEVFGVLGELLAQALDDLELIDAGGSCGDGEVDVGHASLAEVGDKLVLA
jgi:hypothetical protein